MKKLALSLALVASVAFVSCKDAANEAAADSATVEVTTDSATLEVTADSATVEVVADSAVN